MIEAAEIIKTEREDVEFLLPVAKTISHELIEEIIAEYGVNINVISASSYEVMNLAKFVIVASGTATLEAACLGTPMLIIYKTSLLTWLLGKVLVKIPYVGLPNIIMDEEIVPELLQTEVEAESIAKFALQILNSPEYYGEIESKLEEVVARLGDGGAIKRVAKMVLETGGVDQDWN
jgi:lipid-A-disaccharide synthase